MARPAFGGRRALSRIGQLPAFAGVVMLVAGFLAFLGGASGPVLDAGARRLIDGAGATGSMVRVQTRLAGETTPTEIRMPRCSRRSRPPCAVCRRRSTAACSPSRHPRRSTASRCRCRASRIPGCPTPPELVDGRVADRRRRGRAAGSGRRAPRASASATRSSIGDVPVTVVGLWTADDPGRSALVRRPRRRLGSRCRRGRPAPRRRVGARPARRAPVRALDGRARAVRHPALDARHLGRRARPPRCRAPPPPDDQQLDRRCSAPCPSTLARTSRSTSVAAGILGLPLVLLDRRRAASCSALVARAIAVGQAGRVRAAARARSVACAR